MKKFLMALVLSAVASPAFAATLSLQQWSDLGATGYVQGDKTYVLNSTSINLGGPGTVDFQDFGNNHQINIANLTGEQAGFFVNFTVTVNAGPNVISTANVTQNAFNLSNPTSLTTWTPGGATDSLSGTQAGAMQNFGTTSITVNTAATTDTANQVSNMTYAITQTAIPEPSTFALAGLAVVGLVIARRRAR